MNPYGRPRVKDEDKCVNLGIRVPVKLRQQIEYYAKMNGDPVSTFVRKAVIDYIQRRRGLWENINPILDAMEQKFKKE